MALEIKSDVAPLDADSQIQGCLSSLPAKSFFLFAGAGSGKTRSLVTALEWLRANRARELRMRNRQIGVITFTNAARDEVKSRSDFDPIIHVSTIHSFVWELIRGFNSDIRQWLAIELQRDIDDLNEKQKKGRGGKASADRARSIESKTRRLRNLESISEFVYNPNGENRGKDSLNHSEVVQIAAFFLTTKPLMQRLLVARFPILFVDESQDTNKALMESLFVVQKGHRESFALGLFGDTMQRIYSDGKVDLGTSLPVDWRTPEKKVNHRSPNRIITLVNQIRSAVDTHTQVPSAGATEGLVRLFLAPSNINNQAALELEAANRMAEATQDDKWREPSIYVKTLTLEHSMAASRMGFAALHSALAADSNIRIGLLDGTLPGLRLFAELVLPLVEAKTSGDEFTATAIVRESSPLLTRQELRSSGAKQLEKIRMAGDAVKKLMTLWENGAMPRFIDVLLNVAASRLFEIPPSLQAIASRPSEEQKQVEADIAAGNQSSDEDNSELNAWDKALTTSFAQISPYKKYVADVASFGTHQGVKGLEFDRVLAILDDENAGGFLFSYDKLLGAKDKSKTDLENEGEGKETSIDRTRRLFYVVCSRAEKALGVVAYTSSPARVREHVIQSGLFLAGEVVLLSEVAAKD